MTRTERIQKIMDKYEISAKIGFGQNFLMDDKAIEKMEEAIFSFNNPIIAEIGCGLGSLTFGLLNKAEKVIGYDIDKDINGGTYRISNTTKDTKIKLMNKNNEITVLKLEDYNEDKLDTGMKLIISGVDYITLEKID